MTSLRLWLLLLLVAGCSERSNECHADSDCTNLAFPFCDVDGEYAAAGGLKNVCTITPPDCKPERCGCTPNATTCTDGTLTVCNADGRSVTTTSCVLGCASDATRCGMFAPSNGLGDALQMAADEPDVELPASVVIHDTGLITEVGTGATIAVKNFTVQQLGVPAIRVFVARSFKIHDADLVTNGAGDNNPIAFVASGSIEIAGRFASPPHFAGPGGQSATSSCAGAGESGRGGGGGGNATAGGRGAPLAVIPAQPGAAGGGVQPDSFSPLAGGCPGGSAATNGGGGAGGAAFQFVSATSITIAQTGIVSAPGLAGSDNEGGGAGGNIVFETPLLAVDGRVAANGGSGGACGLDGNDGSSDLVAAASVGGCMSGNGVGAARSGTGGTGAIAPTDATADTGLQSGGGGGGAAGRVSIKTADGTYAHGAASIVSAKISASALTPQ